MKRAIIVVVLLAVVGGGAGAWYSQRNKTEIQVTTAPLSRGDIVDTVGATGTLQAVTTVQVGSQVSGNIQWLGADFNSIVKKGQVIARLDPSLFDAQLNQVQANLVQARANLTKARSDLDRTRVQLTDAQLGWKTRAALRGGDWNLVLDTIEPMSPALSVRRQCDLLGLNRSSYYLKPADERLFNLHLMRLIDEQYLKTPFYGYPKMTIELQKQGYAVNRKRIARLPQVVRVDDQRFGELSRGASELAQQ